MYSGLELLPAFSRPARKDARLGSAATPLFQHKQFLVGWGGSYGNEYRHMYLLTPYLATINNLSSAVVKDANKTMKITYTLTQEA